MNSFCQLDEMIFKNKNKEKTKESRLLTNTQREKETTKNSHEGLYFTIVLLFVEI